MIKTYPVSIFLLEKSVVATIIHRSLGAHLVTNGRAAHIARTEISENPDLAVRKTFLKSVFSYKNYCIFEEISSRAVPSM